MSSSPFVGVSHAGPSRRGAQLLAFSRSRVDTLDIRVSTTRQDNEFKGIGDLARYKGLEVPLSVHLLDSQPRVRPVLVCLYAYVDTRSESEFRGIRSWIPSGRS